MNKFARSDSPIVILATLIGGIIGVTAVLWVLKPYVDKKQLIVVGFTIIIVFIVTNLIRWYKN
jgi:predicted tellurium resistance membrane protein TerC